MELSQILIIVASSAIGVGLGSYLMSRRKYDEVTVNAQVEARRAESEAERKRIIENAKQRVIDMKRSSEAEQKEFGLQITQMEKMYDVKLNSHKKRETRTLELQKLINDEHATIEALKASGSGLHKQITQELVRMTGIPLERVREDLINSYEQTFKNDAEMRIQKNIEWTNENAVRDGRDVLSEVMTRYGAPVRSKDDEVNVITVQRDEVKGRIVGKGARNIAFFEELYGVDVIFNDEPNTIIVSCFNLVQREIARYALERLMREKIINEEVITKMKATAEQEVNRILQREGERALNILGLKNMPPDFAKLIGRLRYRTSYGQNIMRHCFEVGYFSRMIANEVGANAEVAFLGGFFHDIGKAIDQEVGGSHDVLSKEILEKYGFSWEITHAAWTHHNAIPQETVEAHIVQAADAISAGRPGARAESVERYMAKIRELQDTALSFAGVKKAFAINAGREVRIIVDSDKVNDDTAHSLAKDVAAKVQEKGGYPGKIKIVTIRTTKATDYAR